MALAIFDLDHTLLAGDSDHAWGQYLVDNNLVDSQEHQRRNDEFYAQYQAGTLDIEEYLSFAMRPLTQYPRDVMETARSHFLDQRIKPLISQRARDLLDQHRADGDTLLIITATNGFVTYPIAELLDVQHIIAPHPEVVDGRYTGRCIGTPSFQSGKVTRLNQWLEEFQHTLEGSYFYSDSHNDLPLLSVVDYPVAVSPDDRLRFTAESKGWPIISLEDPH